MFSATFLKRMTATNFLKAFASTGISPLNHEMVNWKKCEPAESFFDDDDAHHITPGPGAPIERNVIIENDFLYNAWKIKMALKKKE